MSARRCSGCGAFVRKPHEPLCPVASKKAAKNFAEPARGIAEPKVFELPAPSTRADIANQERTLLSFYRPADALRVHLACNDDGGNFDHQLFAVEIHDSDDLLCELEFDPLDGFPFDIDGKTGELVFGETVGDRFAASGRARWVGNMAWDCVEMHADTALRLARYLLGVGFGLNEFVCEDPWQGLQEADR